MQVKQQMIINATAERVWDILGHQYGNIAQWASGVHASKGHNVSATLQDAPYSGRICETNLGALKETITRYDEREKILSYNAQGDKMPFFVRGLSNTWVVTSLGNDKAQVDMCMEASLLPVFNLIMGPVMQIQMGGILKQSIEELRYFAENNVPHPRKLEAQQKLQFKTAS
ncbi:SRPBCC family protein [Leptothoe sp. PORK10 BA2]|uniref:SRPBCC family protein n=1 Tax=Leptothoe sp. PORK10 BA2 TaxID=3110254 RepID=UPI002B216254|nr:SRPBCC family protein [Leptothoe sp. PORK10 BA2]MEA5464739.1 SRPBCC family protein [Leptothoe sp. PORK10 BA2]